MKNVDARVELKPAIIYVAPQENVDSIKHFTRKRIQSGTQH